MTLLRRRSLLPTKTAQVSWMGYGDEEDSTVIELMYEYNREKIDRGDGYGQVRWAGSGGWVGGWVRACVRAWGGGGGV